jgi:hypothetical protein
MRNSTLLVALLISAAPAAAQQSTPTTGPSGPTATAIRIAMANAPPREPNAGPARTAYEEAQQFMHTVREACDVVEHAGKLWASCDNSEPAAKLRGTTTYVPQNVDEWPIFAAKVQAADRVLNDVGRVVVVLNQGKPVVEASSTGFVTLK